MAMQAHKKEYSSNMLFGGPGGQPARVRKLFSLTYFFRIQ